MVISTTPKNTIVPVTSILPQIDDTRLTNPSQIKEGVLKVHLLYPLSEEEKREMTLREADRFNCFRIQPPWGIADACPFFLDNNWKVYEPYLDFLKEEILVDLGAGHHLGGFNLARRNGARAYIGDEPYYADILARKISEVEEEGTLSAVVDEPMLDFLERLPPESVSFLMSGITQGIIPNKRLREEIGKQIQRVLSRRGGYIACYGSIPIHTRFHREIRAKGDIGIKIFRK